MLFLVTDSDEKTVSEVVRLKWSADREHDSEEKTVSLVVRTNV